MNGELDNFVSELKKISDDAQKTFGNLSAEQINWKPSAESWSVGQCFEHLNVSNEGILSKVEQIVQNKYQKTFWEHLPFLPNFFGGFILKATNPENTDKRKAPGVFRPARSEVGAKIIEEFAENQKRAISLIKATENLNLAKTIITSPVAKFVTYSLQDAYKIIVTHERRHFQQAEKVLQTQGFPK